MKTLLELITDKSDADKLIEGIVEYFVNYALNLTMKNLLKELNIRVRAYDFPDDTIDAISYRIKGRIIICYNTSSLERNFLFKNYRLNLLILHEIFHVLHGDTIKDDNALAEYEATRFAFGMANKMPLYVFFQKCCIIRT
ncbi:MAG: hypothetical protein DRP50_03140 [Thermotoga sp.]|nr:hypothetical protein [Thermotogota bacterium]RKX55280.1 MAG: hypothetical protein DRP50_03140 [Thermotoga sp.]